LALQRRAPALHASGVSHESLPLRLSPSSCARGGLRPLSVGRVKGAFHSAKAYHCKILIFLSRICCLEGPQTNLLVNAQVARDLGSVRGAAEKRRRERQSPSSQSLSPTHMPRIQGTSGGPGTRKGRSPSRPFGRASAQCPTRGGRQRVRKISPRKWPRAVRSSALPERALR
jgi:hypothetical protein